MDATRKLRHDIGNHIQTIEQLKGQYEGLKWAQYCQDIVVDSILNNKERICREVSLLRMLMKNIKCKRAIG